MQGQAGIPGLGANPVSGPGFTPRRGVTGTPYMRWSPYKHETAVWSKDVLSDIAQSENDFTAGDIAQMTVAEYRNLDYNGVLSGRAREWRPEVLYQKHYDAFLETGDVSELAEMERYVSADAPVLSRPKEAKNLLDRQLCEIPRMAWNSLGRYKPFTADEGGVTFHLWPCAFWLVLFTILIFVI